MKIIKTAFFIYGAICTIIVTGLLVLLVYVQISLQLVRAELPNGSYLQRAALFSDVVILRDASGNIIANDVQYVVFDDRWVAGLGEGYFLYDGQDGELTHPDDDASHSFEEMLNKSAFDSYDLPYGKEDPRWLNFERLIRDKRYRRNWHE